MRCIAVKSERFGCVRSAMPAALPAAQPSTVHAANIEGQLPTPGKKPCV